ncbi:MAG: class I SAM-dependent methyltransferase [Acidobacteria bacterium]|nr:class I SAM-dependent methyltransferase [Acidobacteriota bacterium]
MISPYRYNDAWDDTISLFIQSHNPYDHYWSRSEEYALAIVRQQAETTPRRRFLDLGCGRGRLLRKFAPLFATSIALEPDPARSQIARHAAASLQNVRVDNCYLEQSPESGFDFVLCSHVLQHVPVGHEQALLNRIAAVLNPGGMLALITSHSMLPHDAFKLWSPEASGVVEQSTDQMTFDDLASRGSGAVVPTHAFSLQSLHTALSAFQIVRVHCFHALHKWNPSDLVFRDRWINWPGLQGSFGIDVLFLARKR